MSQEQATLLKRALIQGVSERYNAELAESKKSVACSQAHLLKMSEILGFDVQKAQRARRRKRVAAAIILAAALAIGSLTAYGYREQIRDFFIQIYEEYIVLVFPGEQQTEVLTEHYKVGYVPDGYTLANEEYGPMRTHYEWRSENGQLISFSQLLLSAEFRYHFEQENATTIEHEDLEIYCVQFENATSYTWNDGKYAMDILDYSELPVEEILKIIDSVS